MNSGEIKREIRRLEEDIKLIKSLTNFCNYDDNQRWIKLIEKEIDKLNKLCYSDSEGANNESK